MQSLNNLVTRATQRNEQTSRTQSQTTGEQQTSDFSQHERDATGYLFVQLQAMYPNKFSLIWPSEKELQLTKRSYAKDIGRYNRKQIDEALTYMKALAAQGDKAYLEPNVLLFLQVIGQLNINKAMYRHTLPPPPESKEDRAARRQLGMQRCSQLRSMFDE